MYIYIWGLNSLSANIYIPYIIKSYSKKYFKKWVGPNMSASARLNGLSDLKAILPRFC